jgi:peptidoglycan-associated lipoprotein
MRTRFHIPLITISLIALTACTPRALFREAGSQLDEGAFGNPTMQNNLLMRGDVSAIVTDLSQRFAAEVPTTLTFEFDSAHLDDAARNVLRQQASWIRQFPEVRFSVYGHTDLVGSDSYNENLGRRRAQTAVNYLVTQGIERERLEALVSLGESQPVIATADPERRNRRTVTEVSGFVTNHPMVLDGNYAQLIYRSYVSSGAGNNISVP